MADPLTVPPAAWLEVALPEPCRHWAHDRYCGAAPTRLYTRGRRCWAHAPTAITPVRKEADRG
ncbi:hypothetical protein BJF83_17485 [Nocardiopsis sp. CNR-923]|uniref:hypothetical protein n=1 Tax=Nocardiopsis sp. CNR-923 TaxID=1904965 RepID=UPI000968720B|nr:hypothetical protein [Nocardiopsis sp. CNR-923]OLT27776.1 hypothetical protein BJF83_17485 [Nocardiopsis sp. CNR-923]